MNGKAKKWIVLILAAVLMTVLAATVSAEDDHGGIVDSGDCGDNLTWTLYEDGLLEIDGTGEMWDYDRSDGNPSPWSDNTLPVTSVELPDGITKVGASAFNGCYLIQTMNLPDSIEIIGDRAFMACNEWSGEFHLPANLKKVGWGAFSECYLLTGDIVIPEGVTEIGNGAFFLFNDETSATFLGDAPTKFDYEPFFSKTDTFTLYYLNGKSGWTTPEWNGYPCYPIDNTPDPDDQGNPDPGSPINPDPGTPGNPNPGTPDETVPPVAFGIMQYNILRQRIAAARAAAETPAAPTEQENTPTEPEPTPAETLAGPETPAAPAFLDVDPGAWYADAVRFVAETGLMNGTGDDRFSPGEEVSRAMLVTILYRLSGDTATGESGFTDVAPGTWYAEAVAWAADNDIVNGIGNGLFAPDQSITREQLLTVLYRYANARGYNTASSGTLDVTDAESVSAYAVDAVTWAVSEGLTVETDDGALNPQGAPARAEIAVFLYRFCTTTAK